jgi:hypothetical protein
MKKIIAAFTALLLAMAALPVTVVSFSRGVPFPASDASADSPQQVLQLAAGLCPKDCCDETLRAALIIARTDQRAGYAQKGVFNSDIEILSRLQGVYNSDRELYLSENGKLRAIPFAAISNGCTVVGTDFPYLSPVASPWDCLNAQADEQAACVGVSLYGVEYLCEQGYSAEQALCYYLPGFTASTL